MFQGIVLAKCSMQLNENEVAEISVKTVNHSSDP